MPLKRAEPRLRNDSGAPDSQGVSGFSYRAFISYSHKDSATAAWLHGQIESYRIPARLIGRTTATGTISRRIGKIFRDRDELPVASDLSGKINEALRATQSLIVLCSPASAQSKWVNQEIINFKRMKGADSIIAVIVSGEPFASALPGRTSEECFPHALRFHVDADGNLTGTPAEPIAADLRPGKDSKRLVKMKVLAGLLGVSLDELILRDNARRQKQMLLLSAASVAGMGVMSVLTVFAINARDEAVQSRALAEERRGHAEDLIEFMLGDLRDKLEPVGRLDVLDSVGEKAMAYYSAQTEASLDADAMGRQARSLLLLGEIADLEGSFEDARTAIQRAAATTEAMLEANPDNAQRLYDHAQSTYWLGYIDWRRNQITLAESAFKKYQEYSRRLVEIAPDNIEWRTELGHSYVNLGVVLFAVKRYQEALAEFTQAADVFQDVIARGDQSPLQLVNAAQALSWSSDCWLSMMHLEDAQASKLQEIGFYERILERDPENKSVAQHLIVANGFLGQLALEKGAVDESLTYRQRALNAAGVLAEFDPANTDWAKLHAQAHVNLAESLFYSDRTADAAALLDRTDGILATLRGQMEDTATLTMSLEVPKLLLRQRIRMAAAPANANGELERLAAFVDAIPDDTDVEARKPMIKAEVAVLQSADFTRRRMDSEAKEAARAALAILTQREQGETFENLLLTARAQFQEQQFDGASQIVNRLTALNYGHPLLLELADELKVQYGLVSQPHQ